MEDKTQLSYSTPIYWHLRLLNIEGRLRIQHKWLIVMLYIQFLMIVHKFHLLFIIQINKMIHTQWL